MATGKAENKDFAADALFGVSHIKTVVTGGGTGIGLMITQGLQSNGAKVYIIGRRKDTLEQTAKLYGTGPGSIVPLVGDIGQKDEVLRLTREIESREPNGIQLLVNNAGIAKDDDTKYFTKGEPDWTDAKAISEHFLQTKEEQWVETMKVNVAGAYYMSLAFLPLLKKGCDVIPGYTSQVVNVSSLAGVLKESTYGQPIYLTSKAALTHLSRMLATIFKGVKVRVNVIAPGLFPSEMTTGSSGEDNKSKLDIEFDNTAGRPGHDTEMAAAILFLAGKGGLFYNGQVLYLDGGEILIKPAVAN